MTRRKRSIEPEAETHSSQLLQKSWIPTKTGQSSSYLYVSPSHSFGYDWNDATGYHNEFLHRKTTRQGAISGSRHSSMANVMPWLLSMCLLGAQDFTLHPGTNALARDHRPPGLRTSTTTGFRSSLRNYKALISTHDELPGHINCDSPNHQNSVDKSPTTPEYSNHLYGSTPESIGHYPSSFNRNGLYSSPTGRILDAFKSDPRSLNRLDSHGSHYALGQGHIEENYVGPAMELVFAWPTVDFEYDSVEARDSAIFDGDFIAENNLPLGIEIWREKVFLTLPKWKSGIPATLATVPRYSKTKSPKLRPYPNWEWHRTGNCDTLTSVFRVQVDECDRLWVLDSGKIDVATNPTQICPPAIFIFDLKTDSLLKKYTLPDDQVKQDSLYTNIVVDIRNEECESARAYISDVFRYGLVVYDLPEDSSFRIEHHFFFPDPLASRYELHGLKFQWTDGIFGIALSPVDIHEDRTLFFHPMSSFREFAVSTSVLRDKRTVEENSERFMPIGRPRAKDYGHSSGSAVDRNGVMFFNMVTRDSVWCWDTRKEYIPQNFGVIGTSNLSLVFPNDIKVDHEYDQNVWVISNRLAMYLYGSIDSSKVNYRVFKANVNDAIKGTVCDPNYFVPGTEPGYDETC